MVYEELIGSFTRDEINLFTPWIDRDDFGNLIEAASSPAWSNVEVFERDYKKFSSESDTNQ